MSFNPLIQNISHFTLLRLAKYIGIVRCHDAVKELHVSPSPKNSPASSGPRHLLIGQKCAGPRNVEILSLSAPHFPDTTQSRAAPGNLTTPKLIRHPHLHHAYTAFDTAEGVSRES
jgi:hypothetical protein